MLPPKDELLVGHAVFEGDATGIDGGPSEHAAHILPDLGGSVQDVSVGRAGACVRRSGCGWHRAALNRDAALYGRLILLAGEQLAPQLLSLRLLHVRDGDSFVRRTACRVDADRAHAEDALQQRHALVHRLDALIGNVDALLVEDAAEEVELLGAQLVI